MATKQSSKIVFSLLSAGLMAGFSFGQSSVTLIDEDFEDSANAVFRPDTVTGPATATLVADPDPLGLQGSVLALDISDLNNVNTNMSEFGNVRHDPDSIPLPSTYEAGVSMYTLSMKVFIPSNTTFGDRDTIGMILRWNGINGGDANGQVTGRATGGNALARDEWVTLTSTAAIPNADPNGIATAGIVPFVAVIDRMLDAAEGTAVFIDDIELSITVPQDDPNLLISRDLDFGVIDVNSTVTKPFTLTNSGATQDLVISDLNFFLPDVPGAVNIFTLNGISLPIVIPPNESRVIDITAMPTTIGNFTTDLDFSSNDETNNTTLNSDIVLSLGLTAESIPIFVGNEFLTNGDFETGDTTGFLDDVRYTSSTEFANTGTNSLQFSSSDTLFAELRTQVGAPVQDPQNPDRIRVTPEMIGRDFMLSVWYYLPSTGGIGTEDSVGAFFRWNGVGGVDEPNHIETTSGASLTPDTWNRVVYSGTIPETDINGDPVTSLLFFLSVRNATQSTGEMLFIDDLSLRIDAPLPIQLVDPEICDLVHDTVSDTVTIDYTGTIGSTYVVERSTGLMAAGAVGGWEVLNDPGVMLTEETGQFIDNGAPTGSPNYFYRIRDVAGGIQPRSDSNE